MILVIPLEEICDYLADLPEQFDREPDLIVQVTPRRRPGDGGSFVADVRINNGDVGDHG